MNATSISALVSQKLGVFGLRHRIISLDHVEEVRQEFETKISDATISPEVYRRYLHNDLDFKPPADLPSARSVILVAALQPRQEILFNIDGRTVSAVIPSTYDHEVDSLITRILSDALSRGPYKISRAKLPLKLLAVRSGLAKYGRNNIAYIDGAGSYCRLLAFFSDLPAVESHWREPQMLDQCADCTACAKRCPTGAINGDRFAVHAERCLSFFNESLDPIPEWVDPASHNCLIGCSRCIECCPANVEARAWTATKCEFSQNETAAILGAAADTAIHPDIVALLKRTGLRDELEMLPRNLSLLVNRPAQLQSS